MCQVILNTSIRQVTFLFVYVGIYLYLSTPEFALIHLIYLQVAEAAIVEAVKKQQISFVCVCIFFNAR